MTKTMKLGSRGGVSPTLNAFDNAGESRATVLIMRQREGKPGGGQRANVFRAKFYPSNK